LKSRRSNGFSLIELLIVMGLIGTIAAILLPNIGLTYGSQMALALRDFSSTIRSVFDSAILTGRSHRLVLDFKTGQYWVEAAPLGYIGRPPRAIDEKDQTSIQEDQRTRLIEELGKAVVEPRKVPDDEKRNYSVRSILVNQRGTLEPIRWSEVSDSVLFRRSLPGSVRFASLATDQMGEKKLRSEFAEKEPGYIYFFPDGLASQAAIQLGIVGDDDTIKDDGIKYTLFLDPLTGRSQLLEGFQDAEFIRD
jgi:general secretion pathway protein H